MNDRDAFIRAIIAQPDDDVLRLVYADWLDENGEKERAEFIRLQCSIALMLVPTGHAHGDKLWTKGTRGQIIGHFDITGKTKSTLRVCDCKFCNSRRRERELLTEHEDEWFPFSSIIHVGVGGRYAIQREWRRGFVESITCSWSDWRTHADAIRAATPLRVVRLTTMQPADEFPIDLWPGITFGLPQPADPRRAATPRIAYR